MNYTKRVGTSSVTGNKWVAFGLGARMIALILTYRVHSWLRPEYFESPVSEHTPEALPTVDLRLEQDLDDEEEEENIR